MNYLNRSFEVSHKIWAGNPFFKTPEKRMATTISVFEERDGTPIRMVADRIFQYSILIVGMSRSGKSQTLKRLLYEFYSKTKVNFTVFDPEGEYFVFSFVFPEVKVIGKDIPLDPMKAKEICNHSIDSNKPVIVDLSNTDLDVWPVFVLNYLAALWERAEERRKEGQNKKLPHRLVIDEAQKLLPRELPDVREYPKRRFAFKEIRKLLSDKFAGMGLKRGTALIIATQRTPKIDSEVVNQMSVRLLHRVDGPNDKKNYSNWLEQSESYVGSIVDTLTPGTCIFDAPHLERDKLHIRKVRKLDLPDVSDNTRVDDVRQLLNDLKIKESGLIGDFVDS